MVTLAVRRSALDHPLDASGFLVGAADRLPTMSACSWASAKWAHLDDPDVAVLRASAGRYGDTAPLELTDQDLVAALVTDLGTTMGLAEAPIESPVTALVGRPPPVPAGPPRPGTGVAGGGRRARSGCGAGGAAYDGLGLPACVRQGRHAALAASA